MPDLPAVRLATHSQRQRDGLPLVIADRYSGAALNISNRYADLDEIGIALPAVVCQHDRLQTYLAVVRIQNEQPP